MKPTEAVYIELTTADQAVIDRVLAAHKNDPTQLIGILLDVQGQVTGRFISQAAAVYVAGKLGLKITQVYDVISFYTALHDTPQAQYPLEVCASAPCKVNGADSLLDLLADALGISPGETTADGRFSLRTTPCFGACDVAPAVRCNGVVYGQLTSRERVAEMLRKIEEGGTV